MEIQDIKDALSILDNLLILILIPAWRIFSKLNKTLNELNSTVRFLEHLVLDTTDDATVGRVTKKTKLKRNKYEPTNNI